MGAYDFFTEAQGETPQLAFNEARDQAAWDYGHSGYTGTIAEKDSFTMIASVATKKEAENLASDLISVGDERIDDKWGPAGCIEITDLSNTYLFFGWASA